MKVLLLFLAALKIFFTQSPRGFRLQPNWELWQKEYQGALALRNNNMHLDENVQVELVHYPATPIAVLQHRGAPNLLGNSIAQFIRWRKENALPPCKSKTFNLIYDDPNANNTVSLYAMVK